MTERAMLVKDNFSPKKHMCAQSPFLAVIGSIQPKNDSCAQSWEIDMAATQCPSTDNRRRPGGARPGAGRPSSYTPLVAEQMTAYVKTTAYPSLKHFCACYGYRPAQVRAWELQGHRCLLNALGTLRYRQDVDMGRAA